MTVPRAAALLLALAALIAFPLVVRSAFTVNFAILVLLSAYLGQSWNIAGGYAGQFSFGHVVFFGTGAYAATLAQLRLGLDPWAGLAVGALAGGLVGLLIAVLAFRAGLRGSYFALITLAFAEVFRILSNSFEFTGAGTGLLIPLAPGAANFQFPTKTGFYYVALVLAAGSLALAWWLERARFGARLIAIRENEDAAAALGVDTLRAKIAALVLSGAMAGIGGVFYAQLYLYIEPAIAYGAEKSVEMLLVSIIGGMGTVFGPLLGALVLHGVNEATRHYIQAPGLSLVIYGLILMGIVGFLPNGLIGLTKLGRRRA